MKPFYKLCASITAIILIAFIGIAHLTWKLTVAPSTWFLITVPGFLLIIFFLLFVCYRFLKPFTQPTTAATAPNKDSEIQKKLKESEEKFKALYDTSSDALMTLEPPDWKFTDGNLSAIKLFNTTSKEEFCSIAPWDLSPAFQPDGRSSNEKAAAMITKAMREGSHFFEWTHKKYKGGEFFATVLLTRLKLGEKEFLQATVRDITESKKAQEALKKSGEKLREKSNQIAKANDQLEVLATHDILTGLPNRRYFENEISKIFASSSGLNKKKFALLLVDIDSFKWINDTFGHDAGDATLKALATILVDNVRKTDIVARLGGDEFVIILKNIENHKVAFTIADKIANHFKEPISYKSVVIYTSLSMGVTFYPSTASSADELLKQADIAMYNAKSKGIGCIDSYSEEVRESYTRANEIIYELQLAIKNNELSVVYQPIVSMVTQQIIGVEALLRWENTKLGNVNPDEFIPIAEKAGLINEIGLWAFNEACKQVSLFKKQGINYLFLAINISPHQFSDEQFSKKIAVILSDNKISAQEIEIELTESAVKNDSLFISKKLINFLTEFEFQLSIDDFGTGYSSLERLSELPVNTLKIDKSFIKDLRKEDKRFKIVKSTIAMASAMALKTIAEGIETKEEADLLIQLGCLMGQGFYYYKPMNPDELMMALETCTK